MSEMHLPEVSPPPSPSEPGQAPQGKGSLALGVAIAWGINVVGGILLLAASSWLMPPSAGMFWVPVFGLVIPILVSVGVALWMNAAGRTRTAVGILIGIASIWALVLLLVAACFGLMTSAGFG